MGLRLKIEGNESIQLNETIVTGVKFHGSWLNDPDHRKDPCSCGRRGG